MMSFLEWLAVINDLRTKNIPVSEILDHIGTIVSPDADIRAKVRAASHIAVDLAPLTPTDYDNRIAAVIDKFVNSDIFDDVVALIDGDLNGGVQADTMNPDTLVGATAESYGLNPVEILAAVQFILTIIRSFMNASTPCCDDDTDAVTE